MDRYICQAYDSVDRMVDACFKFARDNGNDATTARMKRKSLVIAKAAISRAVAHIARRENTDDDMVNGAFKLELRFARYRFHDDGTGSDIETKCLMIQKSQSESESESQSEESNHHDYYKTQQSQLRARRPILEGKWVQDFEKGMDGRLSTASPFGLGGVLGGRSLGWESTEAFHASALNAMMRALMEPQEADVWGPWGLRKVSLVQESHSDDTYYEGYRFERHLDICLWEDSK